jgi:ABC-type multidrug transport system permease subunit
MKAIRFFNASLLALIGINALGGGAYGMSGAEGLPVEWLHNSPFKTYFIPSLFLFLIIGGACFLSSLALFKNKHYARKMSFLTAALLIAWILIQLFIIGYVSWLQPAILIAACLVLILNFFLRDTSKTHL